MNRTAIYEAHTGRIVQLINGFTLEEAQTLLKEGQQALEVDSSVTYRTHYISDGQAVPMAPKPSPDHEFDWTTHQWVDPRTLGDLKAQKWSEIKRARDSQEFGGFEWDGSTFDSDPTSQSRIQGAAQLALMSDTYSVDWTLANNEVRTLAASDVLQVGVAMGMHINAAHARARVLRERIEAATTEEDLESIQW